MIDMQKLAFFAEGNLFTGSVSEPAGRVMRYRVEPDRENEQLTAWRWQTDRCFERAGETARAEFRLTQQGLDELIAWLEAAWQEEAR
ncbi:hypothetical protein [Acutalibacter caecimuris]|uniref:hypothetical protein n=1 Tax=Acutalibacter caecimuris TaxID=3093657 RepID=UPI002AC9B0CF|nr:hypothetical protein [Acutalibacter sp. M00118]